MPVALMGQLLPPNPSVGWIAVSNLGRHVIWNFFSHDDPYSGERQWRGYIVFNFTVNEGKRMLNPSHDEEEASTAETR